jgi:phenylalanyl-tRNA synthetase beta chain
VVVPAGRSAADLEHAILDSGGSLLRDVRLFDVYPLPTGERSLAFRLTFQAVDRTLTESEAEAVVTAAMRALERAGGRLRT